MNFLLQQEATNRWTWEFRNERGETLCRSAGSFRSREEALAGAQAVRTAAPGALVFDPLGTLYESI
jgi:uncharacterized protein YegP (UPF0339 family)